MNIYHLSIEMLKWLTLWYAEIKNIEKREKGGEKERKTWKMLTLIIEALSQIS